MRLAIAGRCCKQFANKEEFYYMMMLVNVSIVLWMLLGNF